MTQRRASIIALLVVTVGVLAPAALRRGDARAGGSRRYAEAVVVPGSEITVFAGATADELWVWTWSSGQWDLVVSQLDERAPDGTYVAAEDGALDENDELVFPMPLFSAPAPEGQWPPGMDRDAPWVRVRVVDPLQSGVEQTAYVVFSRGGPEIALPPQVRWDEAAAELRTASYVLGFAKPLQDGFVGFKRLSLYNDDTDLLDRLKLRVTVSVPPFGEQEVTEETLALLGVDVGALAPDPVIVGPVRVVLAGDGSAMAYRDRIAFAMGALEDWQPQPGMQLKAARASLDLAADAVPARYFDPNVPQGVTIDGAADEVPEGPLPPWREIRFASGHLSLLRHPVGDAPTAAVYYVDQAGGVTGDTGDGSSYGDQGVRADTVGDVVASGFPGQIVVSPSDLESMAALLAENLAVPVQLEVTIGNAPPTPTAGATTSPTTTPTLGATRSPSPTSPVGGTSTEPRPTEPGTTEPGSTVTPATPEPHTRLYAPVVARRG